MSDTWIKVQERKAGSTPRVKQGPKYTRWGWLRERLLKLGLGREVVVDLRKAQATETQLRNTCAAFSRRNDPPPPPGHVWGVRKAEAPDTFVVLAVKPVAGRGAWRARQLAAEKKRRRQRKKGSAA